MYKSTNGGVTWKPIMNGVPGAATAGSNLTRYSIGLSHPAEAGRVPRCIWDRLERRWRLPQCPRVQVNERRRAAGRCCPRARRTVADNVEGYCGSQCLYDNVIEAGPDESGRRLRSVGCSITRIGTGGIYRSDDGGQTWIDLGYDQHPDFHAVRLRPDELAASADGQRRRRLVQRRPGRPAGPRPIRSHRTTGRT